MNEDLPHILVVDDDERIRQLLRRYLSAQSMIAVTAANAKEAREALREMTFDLVTLDIMMPGESGLNLCRYIKDSTNIPVILLTARAEIEERIEGLSTGADDYLPKPFEPKELVLRIKAILRRTQNTQKPFPQNRAMTDSIQIGPWCYNAQQKRLTRNDDSHLILLTDTEVALLNSLLKRPNTPIRRDILAQQSGIEAQDRAVDVQITRLRKKIEQDPKTPTLIQTIRGQGYLVNIT